MKPILTFLTLIALSINSTHADSDGHATQEQSTPSTLPLTSIFSSEGARISLPQVTQNQPAVIIVYRGSWCPYCMKHLKDLQENIGAFEALGIKVIAISPDKPATATAMKKKFGFTFDVLSDPEMKLGNKLDLGFTLDQQTREKYKGYGIDLEEASGFNHYQLPHPSIFITDAQNNIVFKHSNPDFKERMSAQEILNKAAKAL